jgi:hypothetical protein
MLWQAEEAALFVLPPFFVKHRSLKMGESGGKVHPETSGETKKECTKIILLVFPPRSHQAKYATYNSYDKFLEDTRRVS